jgi:Subtilase family
MRRASEGRAKVGRGGARSARARAESLRSAHARICIATVLATVGFVTWTPQALAVFPFLGKGTLSEPSSWKLAPGETVTNLSGGLIQHFGATPVTPPASEPVEGEEIKKLNSQEDQLCGVMGMSITDAHATMPAGTGSCIAAGTPLHTSFQVTVGRPDVSIAELDSGIKWSDAGDMLQLRKKTLLNVGELPAPKVDMSSTFDSSTGVNCATARAATGGDFNPDGNMPGGTPGGSGPIPYDVLEQGAFDVLDYACDARVANVVKNYPRCSNPPTTKECRNGPTGMLTPEDLIIAFSDGIDHDKNGYVNDIAGWNFVDNNNDPFDEVQYGHGTGEQEDSSAEANNGVNDSGTCPNCEVMSLRVGESFVADANRFAEAVTYATDRGVDIVQEPLGTYNDPVLSREAIDYAYYHGVAVMASAADEAAEHHNQPGAAPHTIVVNAIRGPENVAGSGKASVNTATPPSWLQLDGCTNFGTRIDLSVTGNSCSSEATGKSSGVAGLIYSAALNACGARLYGHCTTGAGVKLAPASDCTRVDGSPCPITANEVLQLLASGNIANTTVNGSSTLGAKAPSTGTTSADLGEGGQADDINTALAPETACSVGMAATCTDPNLNSTFASDENGGVVGNVPDTFKYPSRKGWDEFFGYGRLDAFKSVEAAAQGWIPPEADITSPEWFQQVDPTKASFALDGYVNARTSYTCRVEIAPGAQPNNASTTASGDFASIPSTYCDGKTAHSTSFNGLLAAVSTATLEALFPKGSPTSFTGNENGGPGLTQSSNGRPNTLPYAFTARVVVATAAGAPGPAMTGEDRRQMFLHRDAEMLKGFPIEMKGDGDASPVLVDLAGNNTNQLIVGNSDGWIHAYQYSPSTGAVSDLPGWPVHTEPLPLHSGEHAFSGGGLTTAHYDPVMEAPAAGDLFGDGRKEIVADDLQGNVYAWDSTGKLVFHQTSNPSFSGGPLSGNPAWEAQRQGTRQRTEVGFITSPVLADLEPEAGPGLAIIAAGEDRHLYAWHPSGEAVKGFPVLVEDPDKVASVDPASNQPTFNANVPAGQDKNEDQGKIVDTPAVASLDGPGKPPSILVGTNEEYLTNRGDEGGLNAAKTTTASLGLLGETGVLNFANGRVYAIKASGCSSEPSSCATGGFKCASSKCTSDAFRTGWPAKIGIIDAGLLPDVGEGINGSPVVAPITCPEGGEGLKIGVTPDAGPGYVLNADGSSCYGSTEGAYNALETDFSAGNGKTDTPAFPAVGEPAFGTLDGTTTNIFAPVGGLLRALDIAVSDYQKGGQDFIGAWNANSSQFSPGFPAVDNDLSFITGQVIGDITGESPKQEVVAGTASQDLVAFNAEGGAASTAWPKLTGGWMVATPALGSLGTLDTSSGAKKDVVSITREGTLSVYSTPASACSPSSWPNFHHDIANSGDYTRDAIAPGRPMHTSVGESILSWTAPGGDLMCGTATSYQLVTSASPITPENFASATPISGAPAPAAAGTAQSFKLPPTTKAYVAIRAIDEQGNIGLPAVAEFNSGPPLPAIGRCVVVPSGGEYKGPKCNVEAHGKGIYNWLSGPGAKKKFAGHLTAVTLETVGKAKVTCSAGSSAGEYTGGKTETLTLTLTGCKRAGGEACQSVAAGAGEIVTSALEGEVGFISGRSSKTPVVGLDFKHEPTLIAAECGSGVSKTLLTVEGSAIGAVTVTGKMTLESTLKYKASSGIQAPEQFEAGIKDTLLMTFVTGAEKTAEQAGLTTTAKDLSEELMEIKAKI